MRSTDKLDPGESELRTLIQNWPGTAVQQDQAVARAAAIAPLKAGRAKTQEMNDLRAGGLVVDAIHRIERLSVQSDRWSADP